MEQFSIETILVMVNVEEKSLEEVGKIIGKSKSSVQRILVKNGYKFDRVSKKYVNNNNVETINNDIIENNNFGLESGKMEQVKNETLKEVNNKNCCDEFVSRTYTIPKKLERALKIKGAIEDKDIVEIVRDALNAYIEEKYFEF